MTKLEQYVHLDTQLRALLSGERDFTANASSCAALLYHSLPEVNWVGFYRLRGEELIVGPFQGRPACVRIALPRGVCGTAATRRESIVVENVDAFPGHIACDAASRSEVVIPMVSDDGRLLGVLDIDSPVVARFDDNDRRGLETIVATLLKMTDEPVF
ncbi:MAG: GAF domain-containing protein [Pirellulaceae bacterium]|nr:GAF domain-containing protein [Pirellulaceae bacterium]